MMAGLAGEGTQIRIPERLPFGTESGIGILERHRAYVLSGTKLGCFMQAARAGMIGNRGEKMASRPVENEKRSGYDCRG